MSTSTLEDTTVARAGTPALMKAAVVHSFTEPLLFTGGGPQGSTMTILLLIYNYAFVNGDYGAATALSVLLALALAVLSAVFQFATRGWSTE